MFGWYKLRKFYAEGVNPSEWWDRQYEQDGVQWDDPEEYRKQLFYPLLIKYLEAGKTYINVGCGLGGWLAFLQARGINIHGIESSKKAVELAKQLNPDLPIEIGDARNILRGNASIDGYVAVGTWEFSEDGTEKLAQEAYRVIKPGGLLIIEVPYANPFRRWTYLPLKSMQVFIRSHLFGHKPTFVHHIFRKGDISVLLDQLGFEVLEINPHDLPENNSHYGLWVDWPFLRGSRPYELNLLGKLVKKTMNSISPWMIATGMFFVAKKK